MSHSNSPLDNARDLQLNRAIESVERRLSFLKELRSLRNAAQHKPLGWASRPKQVRGKIEDRIFRVNCSCGEVTNYKVPLSTLDDFECPKKNRKEN